MIGNFIAHRADALTSNEPSRFKTNRGTGTLFGTGGGINTASAGSQPNGPPVAFSATPDQNGNLNRLAFGTSLKRMMTANRQPEATEDAGDNTGTFEGRMALGATLANDPPAIATHPSISGPRDMRPVLKTTPMDRAATSASCTSARTIRSCPVF